MNKFVLYFCLTLLYLGLSKSLAPTEFGISYISNKEGLSKLLPGAPLSAILIDRHSTGFLIKTYYHKYKIVYGFQTFVDIIVRTSPALDAEFAPYLGMSVFRRYRNDGTETYTPLPPGSIFIGDKNFGRWINNKGKDQWRFFRTYRQIPVYLKWEDYNPTKDEFSAIKIHESENRPYYGKNKLFGLDGKITKKSFPDYYKRTKKQNINFKTFFKNYLKENFI